MITSNYRIVPIPTEVAEAARRMAALGASDHGLLVADSPKEYPCRHCLRWAEPGERVILFPFASVPPGRPYSESGPIFAHEEVCARYADTATYPPHFRESRVLRAYDSNYDMVDAVVVKGGDPESIIEKLLQNPETDFIHVRCATRGCYTMGIERV